MSECGADYKPDVPDISIYNLASHISGIDVFYLGVPAKRLYLLDTRLRHTAARGRQHVFGDARVMLVSVALQPPSRLHLLISPVLKVVTFLGALPCCFLPCSCRSRPRARTLISSVEGSVG